MNVRSRCGTHFADAVLATSLAQHEAGRGSVCHNVAPDRLKLRSEHSSTIDGGHHLICDHNRHAKLRKRQHRSEVTTHNQKRSAGAHRAAPGEILWAQGRHTSSAMRCRFRRNCPMFCCRAASSPRPINSERYSAVALSTTSNANLQNNLDQTQQPRQSRTPRSVCAKTVCPTCFPPSWRTPGSVARLGARCCTRARTPRYRAPRRGSAQTWCHDQHQGEERHHNSKHVGEGGREAGGGETTHEGV